LLWEKGIQMRVFIASGDEGEPSLIDTYRRPKESKQKQDLRRQHKSEAKLCWGRVVAKIAPRWAIRSHPGVCRLFVSKIAEQKTEVLGVA
jgi:hypothetical protein